MPETLLYGALETELSGATAERDRLWIPLDELERSTGWTAKPEGLCRGEACVPVPAARRADWLDAPAGGVGRLDFAAFAAHLGHALARDEGRGILVVRAGRRSRRRGWAGRGGAGHGARRPAPRPRRPAARAVRLPGKEGAAVLLVILVRLPL